MGSLKVIYWGQCYSHKMYSVPVILIIRGRHNIFRRSTVDKVTSSGWTEKSIAKYKWFDANRLKVSEEKTQIIQCGTIASISTAKCTHIDSRVTWREYTDELSKQLAGALYCLKQVKQIDKKSSISQFS